MKSTVAVSIVLALASPVASQQYGIGYGPPQLPTLPDPSIEACSIWNRAHVAQIAKASVFLRQIHYGLELIQGSAPSTMHPIWIESVRAAYNTITPLCIPQTGDVDFFGFSQDLTYFARKLFVNPHQENGVPAYFDDYLALVGETNFQHRR